jgi:hypothetical protein
MFDRKVFSLSTSSVDIDESDPRLPSSVANSFCASIVIVFGPLRAVPKASSASS